MTFYITQDIFSMIFWTFWTCVLCLGTLAVNLDWWKDLREDRRGW